jgi:hypothetical protein
MKQKHIRLKIPCILLSLLMMFTLLASIIQRTLADPEYIVPTGSIGGFIWIEGNGKPDTGRDESYNGDRQPLDGYIVYLHMADDLTNVIEVAQTDASGVYIFKDIEPGSYVLGLLANTINGAEYCLPTATATDIKFKTDNNDLLVAYTDIIELFAGQAIRNIDAVLKPLIEEIEEIETLDKADDTEEPEETVEEPEETTVEEPEETTVEEPEETTVEEPEETVEEPEETVEEPEDLTEESEVIELEEAQAMGQINAGMLLPTGISPLASKPELWDMKPYSEVKFDSYTWFVTLKETVDGMRCVLLVKKGFTNQQGRFGASTDYNSSDLQARMKTQYTVMCPEIRKIAVVPTLGNHSSKGADGASKPTAVMAESVSKTDDIMFALSYYDVWTINGNKETPGHYIFSAANYPTHASTSAFYLRTKVDSASVFGVRPNANYGTIDYGIHYLATNCGDVCAVWVNGGYTHYTVTVKYVDTDGTEIAAEKTYRAETGKDFPIPSADIPDTISDYTYYQWKIDSSVYDASVKPVQAKNVQGDVTIYLVYELRKVDVTASKVVTGHFINKSKDFEFTASFKGADKQPLTGTFAYQGGTIPGMGAAAPTDGTLTLIDGNCVFSLKHGQTITILNLPGDASIRIVETVNADYKPSFTDSAGASGTNDTGEDFRDLSVSGTTERAFSFFNAQKVTPVPTGITDDPLWTAALPVIAVILILSGWTANGIIRKKLSATARR